MDTFGTRLRVFMDARQMSQLDLAEKSGVSARSIQLYTCDHVDPTLNKLLKICKGLGVKPGELLDGLEENI